MFTYLLLVLLLLCFVHVYSKYCENGRLIRQLPCPRETFFFGNLFSILVSPGELFYVGRKFAKEFGGIYGWWAFLVRSVNICNPEDVETVIASSKHSEKSVIYSILEPWLGEGLLLSNGAKWQHRRKILTPAFHFNILKRYYVGLEENSRRLIGILANTEGKPVDVIPIISEYTLASICDTAMGASLYEVKSGKEYKNTIYKLGELFVKRFTNIHLANNIIFRLSSVGRKTYKYLETVHSFTKKIIKERKEFIEKNGWSFPEEDEEEDDIDIRGKKKKTAMLDLLISAEKDGVIDKGGIQEEVDTFMFEGHDTTAAGLQYCLMLLANHKNVQEKIREELQHIYGDSDREAKLEDQTQMRYLECCIKESLRLYPPVPFISRTLTETTYLSGYKLPQGMLCHIHIYDLHRREDLYKNASEFDPDRFLPENSAGRHPYAYVPFSAGPRNCIGQRFAMMEMKSCLTAILRRFELHPVTSPEDIVFTADLVLRNSNPILIKFVERNKAA